MRIPNAPGDKKVWLVDIEVFSNHFYAAFHNGERWKEYDHTNLAKLAEDLHNPNLVLAGFNNFAYDDLILAFIASDPTCTTQKIYETSRDLIYNKEALRDQIFDWQYADRPWAYSIDVFQLLNGKGSLKEWACRIGSPLVAETPVDFDAPLPDDRIEDVKRYCKNDVHVTKQLLLQNWNRVTLRKTLADKFQLCGRVYCMSEQSVAQHTFLTLHRQRTGQKSAEVRQAAKDSEENQLTLIPMVDLATKNVGFETEPFQAFYTRYLRFDVVGLKTKKGKTKWRIAAGKTVDVPGEDAEETTMTDLSGIRLAGQEFAMGVGGIHTVDHSAYFEATDDEAIIDLDVASYYPSLIIELGLYPSHMGPGFVEDMRRLRDMRLTAKRAGDKNTADALKIVINATFGKLNDQYSPVRSLPNAHRVTINGQLYILMLVEALTTRGGCTIISANTDGVTIRCRRDNLLRMRELCREWQDRTKMELEEVEYARIFRRDVNNYIAVSVAGKIKYKGATNSESGKGDLAIVKEACEKYLLEDVPPCVTIQNGIDNNEWQKFISYLSTKTSGSLFYKGVRIGKRCRWLHTTGGSTLYRVGKDWDGAEADLEYEVVGRNGKTVKRSRLSKIPNCDRVSIFNDATGKIRLSDMDLDVEFYERAAWELIDSLGVK